MRIKVVLPIRYQSALLLKNYDGKINTTIQQLPPSGEDDDLPF